MGNHLYTQQCTIRDGGINFKVRTDDDGPSNDVQVHVFTKDGSFAKDVPLKWSGKATGSDDTFEGRLSLSELPPEVRAQRLLCTSKTGAAPAEVWEGADHEIEAPRLDKQISAEYLTWPDRDNMKYTASMAVASGEIEATWRTHLSQSNKESESTHFLSGFRFTPNGAGPLDPNASEIKVVVFPALEVTDFTPAWMGPARNVTKNIEDMNEMNTITLKRQRDGAFAADADAGKCFMKIVGRARYEGERRALLGFKLALVDPAGHWDSRDGQNYAIGVWRREFSSSEVKYTSESERFVGGVLQK